MTTNSLGQMKPFIFKSQLIRATTSQNVHPYVKFLILLVKVVTFMSRSETLWIFTFLRQVITITTFYVS